jgi:hypothetical protein
MDAIRYTRRGEARTHPTRPGKGGHDDICKRSSSHFCHLPQPPSPPVRGDRFAFGVGAKNFFAPTGDEAGGAAVLHQALLPFPERVAEYALADQGLTE